MTSLARAGFRTWKRSKGVPKTYLWCTKIAPQNLRCTELDLPLRTVQSYDRPVMNNYSYHSRHWSSVSERSVYQLHEHGAVFLSTFAPPAIPLPSRRNWRVSFAVKHFNFPPPCSLDYHSFINCMLSVQSWSAPTVKPRSGRVRRHGLLASNDCMHIHPAVNYVIFSYVIALTSLAHVLSGDGVW